MTPRQPRPDQVASGNGSRLRKAEERQGEGEHRAAGPEATVPGQALHEREAAAARRVDEGTHNNQNGPGYDLDQHISLPHTP